MNSAAVLDRFSASEERVLFLFQVFIFPFYFFLTFHHKKMRKEIYSCIIFHNTGIIFRIAFIKTANIILNVKI